MASNLTPKNRQYTWDEFSALDQTFAEIDAVDATWFDIDGIFGALANKFYVDNGRRTKFIAGIQTPQNVAVGTIWYQLPEAQYTWAEVDALDYDFSQLDTINITWADADKGGW